MRANLDPESFERMKAGIKKMEFRLRRGKWEKLRAGDEIEFTKRGTSDQVLRVLAVAVLNYTSFVDLLEDFDPNRWNGKTLADQLTALKQRYASADELTCTVLGIIVQDIT